MSERANKGRYNYARTTSLVPLYCTSSTLSLPLLIFVSQFFYFKYMYSIQHFFICRPSDSTVPEDAGIEPGPLQRLPDALTMH